MAFTVIPASVPIHTEEWVRALNAPASELEPLTESELEFVRLFKLRAEDHQRRTVLLRKYVLERQQRQGTQFGHLIEELIRPLDERFSVVSVSRRGSPDGWKVTLRDGEPGVIEFQCPLATVEAFADGAATKQEYESLRQFLMQQLNQERASEAAS
jgi:hypothetical protein